MVQTIGVFPQDFIIASCVCVKPASGPGEGWALKCAQICFSCHGHHAVVVGNVQDRESPHWLLEILGEMPCVLYCTC